MINIKRMQYERFGNTLKDHPDVLKQSKEFPTIINYAKMRELPVSFDGRDIWGQFLLPPSKERLSSWALSAKNVLNDRFCILSGGQILVNFDEFEIITCMNIPPNSKVDGVLSYPEEYKTIYQGYSIYDAWEYIYKHGVCQQSCFSKEQLVKNDIKLPSSITDYKDKIKTYGTDCENIEDIGKTSCLTKKDGKPVARRTFFCDAIYNIKGKNLEETIEKIKYDICKYGPVAAGFIVYENFLDKKWNGRTVYTKAEGKPLGGHYISIVGYGKDYWICRNSWGTDWGLIGYFKIKMGIPECKLEDNVSTCMPYFSKTNKKLSIMGELNDKKVNIFDMEQINSKLFKYRRYLRINFNLFYTKETIIAIKNGQLFGDLSAIIRYPQLLPNLQTFWAMDILNYNYDTLAEKEEAADAVKKWDIKYYVTILISCIILFMFGYLRGKKINLINK